MFPKALSLLSLQKTASTAEHKLDSKTPAGSAGVFLLFIHAFIHDVLHIMHIPAQHARGNSHKTSLFNLPVLSIKPKSIYLSYL